MRLHVKSLVMVPNIKSSTITIDPKVQVIDNFLDSYRFKQLQSCIFDPNFDWYYLNGINGDDNPRGSYQFGHGFVVNDSIIDSTNFPLISSVCNSLGCNKLNRIKVNLNPRTIFHRNGGYHLDAPDSLFMKVAILYINTNNGWTNIKGHGKVKCVANRLVKFHSSMSHAGYSCTDEKRKVVLNINYE